MRASAQLNLFFVRSPFISVILSYQHILIVFGKLEYLDKAVGAGGGSWGWLQYTGGRGYINQTEFLIFNKNI